MHRGAALSHTAPVMNDAVEGERHQTILRRQFYKEFDPATAPRQPPSIPPRSARLPRAPAAGRPPPRSRCPCPCSTEATQERASSAGLEINFDSIFIPRSQHSFQDHTGNNNKKDTGYSKSGQLCKQKKRQNALDQDSNARWRDSETSSSTPTPRLSSRLGDSVLFRATRDSARFG
jgi:hypothetical protein